MLECTTDGWWKNKYSVILQIVEWNGVKKQTYKAVPALTGSIVAVWADREPVPHGQHDISISPHETETLWQLQTGPSEPTLGNTRTVAGTRWNDPHL